MCELTHIRYAIAREYWIRTRIHWLPHDSRAKTAGPKFSKSAAGGIGTGLAAGADGGMPSKGNSRLFFECRSIDNRSR